MIRRLWATVLLILACCSSQEEGSDPEQRAATTAAPPAAAYKSLPPEAYLHKEDQERARRKSRLSEIPCSRTRIEDGISVESWLPTDQCVRMLPRQRFRGVWFNRFEVSAFWPDRVRIPQEEPPLWLDFHRSSLSNAEGERAYLLDFEGRRTMYPGSYGYGDYEHEIIVDRVISVRPAPR